MIRFLSPEWITALDRALQLAGTPPASDVGPNGLVIQHVVAPRESSGDRTETAYALTIKAGTGTVTAGRHADPTVTYTQDHECAAAIASGQRNAHDAFMLGDLTITGDTQALIVATDLLAWLDEALAQVRAETTYEV